MESEQNIKAAISTVLLHALLFLVCFFFYIQVQIPVEEIEQGGIVINYGTSETGMGTDIRSMDEPAIGSSILLEKEALKSLSDTLQDIQQNPTPPVKKVAPVISESPSYEDDTAGGNVDIVSSSSADQIYYCVASGSFRSEAEAFEEKRNLDLIGFTGDVIEIKNGTRFQVIIGRYESYEKAVTELKFAKSIDKRFYLLTVKPYRK